MKIYRIIDESGRPDMPLAYLFYYERSRTFSIEISPEPAERDLPIFFYSLVQKGIYSVDTEWSERWVRERIIPEDRQNIGMILRDNGLRDYDLMRLLASGHGRCAQDDCAIREADRYDIPAWLTDRMSRKLNMVMPLNDLNVVICCNDDATYKVDLKDRIRDDRRLLILDRDPAIFEKVRLQPGGNGICWEDWMFITAEDLREMGEPLGIGAAELRAMTDREVVDTNAACDMLGCSRQYVDKLVRDGTLPVIRGTGKVRMYHRSDIERLTW